MAKLKDDTVVAPPKAKAKSAEPAKPSITTFEGTGGQWVREETGERNYVLGDDGEPKQHPGKDYKVTSVENDPSVALVKNVTDESEAVRIFKKELRMGPKVTCRAIPA